MREIQKSKISLAIFRFYKLLLTIDEKGCRKRGVFNRTNKKECKMNMNKEKRRKLLKTLTRI